MTDPGARSAVPGPVCTTPTHDYNHTRSKAKPIRQANIGRGSAAGRYGSGCVAGRECNINSTIWIVACLLRGCGERECDCGKEEAIHDNSYDSYDMILYHR